MPEAQTLSTNFGEPKKNVSVAVVSASVALQGPSLEFGLALGYALPFCGKNHPFINDLPSDSPPRMIAQ